MSREPVTAERINAQARGETASQATVVEQSRAIAEVQGALIVAQQRPRDEVKAITKIREACQQFGLAERAFWKFPRSGEPLVGESIHLAVELARCWGNISYGIKELSRSDAGGESEMLAYAWDLETNARSELGFIVPHKRDTRTGPKALTDMRDIYENNANMGARRVRECIFRNIPAHVIEIAKQTCLATLEAGESEKPLAVRLAELVAHAEKAGISRARLEAKLGSIQAMTPMDAAMLHVSLRSVKRGEITADEEFPRVGADEATTAARRLAEGKPVAATVENGSGSGAALPATDDANPNEEREGDAHPARRVADEIKHAFTVAGNVVDLANVRAMRGADIAAMPDEMRIEVEQAYQAAAAKLKEPK